MYMCIYCIYIYKNIYRLMFVYIIVAQRESLIFHTVIHLELIMSKTNQENLQDVSSFHFKSFRRNHGTPLFNTRQ